MKLVVDTNIMFSYFKYNSVTRTIIENTSFDLVSPEFALSEINRHKKLIIIKFSIKEKKFKEIKHHLATIVEFLPIKSYESYLKKALIISPDPNDVDFFALALQLNIPIWSNDGLLKNQDSVDIFSTKEIINFPGLLGSVTP